MIASRKNQFDRARSKNWEKKNAYRILLGKPERERETTRKI
jgi:hypothetical protein